MLAGGTEHINEIGINDLMEKIPSRGASSPIFLEESNRFPTGAMMGFFSLRLRVQTGFGTHTASCPVGTGM
jgi:hypothetical protein